MSLTNKINKVFATALSTAALSAIATLGLPNQVYAQTFVGTSSGTWGQPNPGKNPNPVSSGVGTNVFTWGNASSPGTFENKLEFTGNQFSSGIKSLFKIGDLTYYNGTVDEGSTVDSVPLNILLTLTKPTNLTEVFRFDFELINTPNNFIDPDEDADSIFPINTFDDRSFTVGNQKYTLELTGFSQDGGLTSIDKFSVREGESTTAAIYGRITLVDATRPNTPPPPQQVPEPGTLVGVAVLGIYIVSRRRSKTMKK